MSMQPPYIPRTSSSSLTGINTSSSSSATSSNDPIISPEFNFSVPSLPPRLSKVGRRISELGNQFLNPDLFDDDHPPGSGSYTPRKKSNEVIREEVIQEVPGMGDDPIMCPFCEKPLPPSLFEEHMRDRRPSGGSHLSRSQTASRAGSLARLTGLGIGIKPESPVRSFSVGSGTTLVDNNNNNNNGNNGGGSQLPTLSTIKSAEPTSIISTREDGKLLAALPVDPKIPTATAESFAGTVKKAEQADSAASASTISKDEISKWSKAAGLKPPSEPEIKPKVEEKASEPPKSKTAFPMIPPPPAPTQKVVASTEKRASGSPGAFGFLRRGSKKKEKETDDEDSDDEDDHAAGSGYARLVAPGSPDIDDGENEYKNLARVDSKPKEEATQPKEEMRESAKVEEVPVEAVKGETQVNDGEIRKVLQEVLGKINNMSQSHDELLHSHAILLTQLKIAKANLAMAEANSEMLEDQLQRAKKAAANATPVAIGRTATPAQTLPADTSRSQTPTQKPAVITLPSKPAETSAPVATATPPITIPAASTSSRPTPASSAISPTRSSLDQPRPIPLVAPTPRRSEGGAIQQPRPRPVSLAIPPSNPNNNGPSTSVSGESKGGWSFWQGGKKKIGGMKFTLPTAEQVFDAIDAASRPPTPGIERQILTAPSSVKTNSSTGGSPSAPFSAALPIPDYNSPPNRPSSQVTSPQLGRSVSSAAVPTNAKSPLSPPTAYVSELAKLRSVHTATLGRLEAMNKELMELKKGKVEMEAELEGLSQALFEEANKMVAEERRKRAELEEAIKEVKEEREALRQTIKVLGGQVDAKDDDEEGEKKKVSGSGKKSKPKVERKKSEKGEGEDGKQEEEDEDEDEEDLPDEFVPRDLDKHYEALRKTIHHVGEHQGGAGLFDSQNPFEAALARDYGTREYVDLNTDEPLEILQDHEHNDGEGEVRQSMEQILEEAGGTPQRVKSISAPTSPNPWASGDAGHLPLPSMILETPTPKEYERSTGIGPGSGSYPFGMGRATSPTPLGSMFTAASEEVDPHDSSSPTQGFKGLDLHVNPADQPTPQKDVDDHSTVPDTTTAKKEVKKPKDATEDLDNLMKDLKADME